MRTAYLQHDLDIREIEEGRSYCDSCLQRLNEVYDPDRFGFYEVYLDANEEETFGFLCPWCAEKKEQPEL
jgi:hypothetical protein